MNEVLLSASALALGYGGQAMLPTLALEVRRGEYWAVLGPNGGGKTTLLRTLLGLLAPAAGSIERGASLRVGYVPQRSDVDLSVPARVLDIVRGGLERDFGFLTPSFIDRKARADLARAALERTQTLTLSHTQFAHLSEGQKQRVLVARAVVHPPSLLVLDEPTSAMDGATERSIFELVDTLRRDHGFAVLMVTHRLSYLAGRATHAVLVDKDHNVALQGRLEHLAEQEAFVERYGFFTPRSPIEDALRHAEEH